jgi:hypothetical protein
LNRTHAKEYNVIQINDNSTIKRQFIAIHPDRNSGSMYSNLPTVRFSRSW